MLTMYSPQKVIGIKMIQSSLARVLILPITSAQPNNKYDVTISDWLSIPLDHFSTIKTSNFVYLPIEKIIKRIGRLTNDDWELTLVKFKQYVSTL